MRYLHYIKESDQYMYSLFMCMDNAWAAEKMYEWGNIGENNVAWAEGPYISAGANLPQVDRSHPYCLRISPHSSKLASYRFGPNPQFRKNGGVPIGNDSDRIKANIIIPTVAICMQFALLEALDIDLFMEWAVDNNINLNQKPAKRYDRRPAKSRMETLDALSSSGISEKCMNAYQSVSNFRNTLTHEPEFFCEVPDCATDVYVVCQAIAYNIFTAMFGDFDDTIISHRKIIWDKRLDAFDKIIEFS